MGAGYNYVHLQRILECPRPQPTGHLFQERTFSFSSSDGRSRQSRTAARECARASDTFQTGHRPVFALHHNICYTVLGKYLSSVCGEWQCWSVCSTRCPNMPSPSARVPEQRMSMVSSTLACSAARRRPLSLAAKRHSGGVEPLFTASVVRCSALGGPQHICH